TTTISDCWKAYDCLGEEGFRLLTVNHSYVFVDPETGSHTQNIERLWRDVRGGVPRYGRKAGHMVEYLAEFMLKRLVPSADRLHPFMQAAATLYPSSGANVEVEDSEEAGPSSAP
ncbi:hypothetical protein PPYR_03767, partial [Photinus pyralis]